MKKKAPATPSLTLAQLATRASAGPFGTVVIGHWKVCSGETRLAALLDILNAATRAGTPAVLEGEALAVAVWAVLSAQRVEEARSIRRTGSELAWLRAQRDAIFGKPTRGRHAPSMRIRWRALRDCWRLNKREALAQFARDGKFNSLAAAARYLRRLGEPDAPAGYD